MIFITIFYLIIVAITAGMVVWNMFDPTMKISDKVTGAIMLVLLVLRLFLIK